MFKADAMDFFATSVFTYIGDYKAEKVI